MQTQILSSQLSECCLLDLARPSLPRALSTTTGSARLLCLWDLLVLSWEPNYDHPAKATLAWCLVYYATIFCLHFLSLWFVHICLLKLVSVTVHVALLGNCSLWLKVIAVCTLLQNETQVECMVYLLENLTLARVPFLWRWGEEVNC